jgi:hypothetical protein
VKASLAGLLMAALAAIGPAQTSAPSQTTDLDAFMARALQRRDVNRQTLNDYVLDEVEVFEILGPGRTPMNRFKREYTWYVRDTVHVRSPVKFDGIPIPESERRAYEDRWYQSELNRRKSRTERDERRAKEGKPPSLGPAVNEPRFISESYFLGFKFDPGNYYLAGRETLDGHEVMRIEYYPTHLFSDHPDAKAAKDTKESKEARKERRDEEEIERKMNKTALITLWVAPDEHQIVKFTFDNVWMDFLPAAWLVRIDDLRASMEMGQPFKGVWLPRTIGVHAGLTLANGQYEASYRREFSNYRQADVKSRVTIKQPEGR